MQLRSNNQMIEKYQGRWAAMRHRWAVGLAAAIRLTVFGITRLLSKKLMLLMSLRWESAWRRSLLLWQWAWHRREANIPTAPENLGTLR
jgi:hypothetical protein